MTILLLAALVTIISVMCVAELFYDYDMMWIAAKFVLVSSTIIILAKNGASFYILMISIFLWSVMFFFNFLTMQYRADVKRGRV